MKLLGYIWLLLCFLFTSCDSRDTYSFSEYRPVVLDSSNVDFDVLNNGFLLTTTIPYKESTISLSPQCRNQRIPYVTSVIVDGKSVSDSDLFAGDGSYFDEQPVLGEDWGEIYHVYNEKKNYTVDIRLNTNCTNAQRRFQIQLGYGYEYVVVEIVQLGL